MNGWLLLSLGIVLFVYAGLRLFRRYDPKRQREQDAEDLRRWETMQARGFLHNTLIKTGGFFIPYFYCTAVAQTWRESGLFVPSRGLLMANMAMAVACTFFVGWSDWSSARERAEKASARAKA